MKLFKVPDPWDYHQQGAVIVMAKTIKEAVEKVKNLRETNKAYQIRWTALREEKFPSSRPTWSDEKKEEWILFIEENPYPENYPSDPNYDEVEELESGIYFDGGCDD